MLDDFADVAIRRRWGWFVAVECDGNNWESIYSSISSFRFIRRRRWRRRESDIWKTIETFEYAGRRETEVIHNFITTLAHFLSSRHGPSSETLSTHPSPS